MKLLSKTILSICVIIGTPLSFNHLASSAEITKISSDNSYGLENTSKNTDLKQVSTKILLANHSILLANESKLEDKEGQKPDNPPPSCKPNDPSSCKPK